MRSTLRRSLTCSILFAALPALAALGCSGSTAEHSTNTTSDAGNKSRSDAGTGTVVASKVTRDLSPSVSASDETSLVNGNTDFALSLYHGLSTAPGGSTTGNLFYSPYSVSLALAMTYAGANGETATQMATALDFTLAAASLHPAFDKLDLAIEAAPKKASGTAGAPFALTLADSLWGDQSVTFAQPFVDTLALDYGASLRTVDFADQPTQAEAAINAWVASETNDKIDPLLPPDAITSSTEFVIVNAVYFDAAWATQFDKKMTQTGPFTRADGTVVQTPIMSSQQAATKYWKGANYQAVELPYSGDTTSMVIVLPDAGAYAAVESGLSGTFFDTVTTSLAYASEIDLTMPSFKIHGPTVSLVPELKALGMTDAFDAAKADFTSMIPAGAVFIGDVLHQAFVDVDENGTEAAAATAVIGVGTAAPSNPVTMTVDRSFFFFIRDLASNSVLFVGREDDPTAQ
jgi:serpin B